MQNNNLEKENLLVSVVVPIYQVEKYLDKCICSILKQTYRNIEIILVDDGSKDLCPTICEYYCRMDRRIKVIHQENGGLVNARKTGINYATGEYVVYVDGDDWISNDYIECYVKYCECMNYDIIWSLAYYREYGEIQKCCGYLECSESELETLDKQDDLYKKVSGEYGFQNQISYTLCMKCFKLSFLKKIQNSLDNRISYDEDFSCIIRGLALDGRVKFIRNDGYYYVQRQDSIIHEQSVQDKNWVMLEDTLNFLNGISNCPEKIRNLVKKQYQISQVYHGCIENLQNDECDEIIPFKNAKKHRRIILYGMGTTGKSLLKFFLESKIVEVVGYMDERCQNEVLGVPYIDFCELKKQNFDYILVSVIKEYFINEIQNKLVSAGVEMGRIAVINLH